MPLGQGSDFPSSSISPFSVRATGRSWERTFSATTGERPGVWDELDLVHLAAGAAPKARRVEDDGVVAPSAADFALHELVGVVHDPADRRGGEAVQLRVLARPLHHPLRGVEVADLSAAQSRRQGRAAGVGEEVEKRRCAAGRLGGGDRLADPPPLRALLGEDAEVAEVSAAELEADAGGLDFPGLRDARAVVPAVPVLAVEGRVRARPFRRRQRRTPQRLRAWTRERVGAEALKLAAVAAVEKFVVVLHLPSPPVPSS